MASIADGLNYPGSSLTYLVPGLGASDTALSWDYQLESVHVAVGVTWASSEHGDLRWSHFLQSSLGLQEQGPKELHAVQVLRASFLRQCLYGWLKLPNAWVKWAVVYSKRIELRWEKKRITVKERESKRCFLLVHWKGKETFSLMTSLWQDNTPLNTSLQGSERRARLQESRSIWRQTNAESFLF